MNLLHPESCTGRGIHIVSKGRRIHIMVEGPDELVAPGVLHV
jgi:hypothetical protein